MIGKADWGRVIDELEEQNDNAYCYVIPNGLVQETILHLLKTTGDRTEKVSLKIKPFLGKFELIHEFIRPPR